jgi:dihydroflavonol-4-reductase
LKKTLVTGATGFVGWHVARLLAGCGHSVRALARDPARLRELDVEPVRGDLRDPDSLVRAVEGCSLVFHVAADYRLWAKDSGEMFRSNVHGTRNLLEAAKSARVDRVVYTSTVGCVGVPQGGVGDEEYPVGLSEMKGAYKRSKFEAEQVALEYARGGLPVVIVNPTGPVGDHDWKPTPTGRIVVDFLRREMPAYIDTGLNLVDVADVAKGHLLAGERGRTGERYILGGENLTLREIFERLGRLSGLRPPSVQIPYAVAYAAGVVTTAWANVTGKVPRAPLDAVRMAKEKKWVTHAKAERELGYQPGPVDEGLRRAIDWFRSSGYVGKG